MKKVLSLVLALLLLITLQTGAAFAATYTPGTYTVKGIGLGGDITMDVTFDETSITAIELVHHTETPGISDRAIAEIPAAIIAAQSTEVDSISGATMTSTGICGGVAEAILIATGQKEAETEKEAAAPVDSTYDASAEQNEYAKKIAWDAQYDVVVAGFGAAGGTAAISAADSGANTVLLTEKAPAGHAGGNSKYAGQDVMGPTSVEGGLKYYTALRGLYTNTSDSMLQRWAEVAYENPTYLQEALGAKYDEFWIKAWPEFPEFECSEEIYTWIVGGMSFKGTLYKLLEENIEQRADKIELWYDAPAKHLIQDPENKIILGMQIEKEGKMLNIRAKNGVVLATGGFEANQTMIQDYLQRPYVYVRAATYNTGDGIKMAMEVGADLWHMGNTAGFSWAYQPEDSATCVTLTMKDGIFVGPAGTRFMNEVAQARHGKINYGGSWISTPTPLPAYYIFDAETCQKPLAKVFSEGNVEEIAKGWIVEADTLEELAEKIGVPVDSFVATVERYNGYCDAGVDEQFGTPADNLVKLDVGPFYAIEIGPTMLNTHGGPRRNEEAQIIDVNGDVIPHLYSAGEMGALFSDMYNGGGNLGECVGFGRIAGANAAQAK